MIFAAVYWWSRSAAKYNTPSGGTFGNTWLFAITDDHGNPLRAEANAISPTNAPSNYGVFISIYIYSAVILMLLMRIHIASI